MSDTKPPPELDAIVDVALAYKSKAKTDSAKKRKRKIKKFAKEVSKPKVGKQKKH